MKKNGFLFWMVNACLILLLLGCSGCFKKGKQTSTTLYIINPSSPDYVKMTDVMIKKFEKSHPGVKVKVDYVSSGEVGQKILVRLAGNTPLDVVNLNDTAFPKFVQKGVFYPLDEFVKNDTDFQLGEFHPAAIKCATIQGKLYSIPPIYGTSVCFYNKTLFKKAGLPYPRDGWTWEEFRYTCQKLTINQNKNNKPTQFGSGGIGFWDWTPMLFQNGGRILDSNGKCVLNSKENLATLQFVKDMYTKDRTVVSQATFSGASDMGAGELFVTGKVGLQSGGLELINKFPKELDWDMVAPPEKKGGEKYFHGGFWGYGITANSKHKELAWEFVKFMTSKSTSEEEMKGVKEGKWTLLGTPSIKSLQRDFLSSLYPGKHIDSYLYCLQYPEFALAQAWGNSVLTEFLTKYNIQENLMGITTGDLKTLLDNMTRDVNEKL